MIIVVGVFLRSNPGVTLEKLLHETKVVFSFRLSVIVLNLEPS